MNIHEYQAKELLAIAADIAAYGDYSALEALGVDVSAMREEQALDKALALAKYGDYSLLEKYSSNAKNIKEKVQVYIQKGAEEAYAYGGYYALRRYLDRQVSYGQITEKTKNQIISALV